MNPTQRTTIAQEQARNDAIEREVARQENKRSPATRAGGFDADSERYDLTAGGQPAGQGRSITTGGIAPGVRVENIVGARAIDAMPRVRSVATERRVLAGDREPKVAIVIRRPTFGGIASGGGEPGYLTPGIPAIVINIYALSRSEDPFGTVKTYPVPPQGNFMSFPQRYAERLGYLEPRCAIGYRSWNATPPAALSSVPEFTTGEKRYRFNLPSSQVEQEVILSEGYAGSPLPPFPRFFKKFGEDCNYDQEIKNEWLFVEQYQVQPAQPPFWTPAVPVNTSENASGGVYFLLTSDGFFGQISGFSSPPDANVETILAMDQSGTIHITFRVSVGRIAPIHTTHHYEFAGGVFTSVSSSRSWRANYANRPRGVFQPDPALDSCISQYQREQNANIIGANLYQLQKTAGGGISYSDLIAEGGLSLKLTEVAIASNPGGCAIGETATAVDVPIPVPRDELMSWSYYPQAQEVVGYAGGLF